MNKRITSFFLSSFLLLAFNQHTMAQAVIPTEETGVKQTSEARQALHDYLNNGDPSFQWELKTVREVGEVTLYSILLTSQIWHGYKWQHQLTLLCPKELRQNKALLFIDGGRNEENRLPKWDEDGGSVGQMMAAAVMGTQGPIAILRQVPNQPLFDDLREDGLISHTLHQFIADKDYSWPLLLPMVKSAVRAMDALQEFSTKALHHPIRQFMISGASKRGWTTWLTAATQDLRVEAIAPMVIDIVNMPASLAHQKEAYGKYSEQIQDYVDLGLTEELGTEEGKEILEMIDPYSYRDKIAIPKLIVMGTNDPYWVVDNVKNYYSELKGRTLLHYVPNSGHGLGDGMSAFRVLGALYDMLLRGEEWPAYSWEIKKKGKEAQIKMTTDKVDRIEGIEIWYADAEEMDFREADWEVRKVEVTPGIEFKVSEQLPSSGYRAFYVAIEFEGGLGETYKLMTRAFIADKKGIF